MDHDDSLTRSASQGDDVDEARLLYQTAYPGDGFRLEPTEQPFTYRYSMTGDADVTLRTSVFRGAAHGVAEATREYIVSWLLEGHGVTDVGADEAVQTLHVPHVAPTHAYEFDYADYRQNLVHLDADYLELVAAEHECGPRSPLTFDHAQEPAGDALRRWRRVLAEASPVLLDASTPRLLRAETNRLVAVTVLDTFSHSTEPAPSESLVAGGPRLRAAVDYMHAHAHEPVGVDEVAAAAGLSIRGLQAALHRHAGTTPTLYLRGVRLDRVRDELTALTPEVTTVADVARRWGFAHLGRFAGAYRTRFGEYPSATLAH